MSCLKYLETIGLDSLMTDYLVVSATDRIKCLSLRVLLDSDQEALLDLKAKYSHLFSRDDAA